MCYAQVWSRAAALVGVSGGAACAAQPRCRRSLNVFPDSAVWASAGVTIPGNLALLCQYRLSGMPAGEAGDSGGPIFKSGSAQYDPLCLCTSVFWGIYFASNGTYEWFSYVEKISDDLDNFVWKLPYP